jgi:hypothetical protein
MRDEDKTKEQLIRELVELRKQLAQAGGPLPISEAVHATDKPDTIDEEAAESEERSRKVFSAERKEDIWVLIISAITVIFGLTGIITKDTFTSLFF